MEFLRRKVHPVEYALLPGILFWKFLDNTQPRSYIKGHTSLVRQY